MSMLYVQKLLQGIFAAPLYLSRVDRILPDTLHQHIFLYEICEAVSGSAFGINDLENLL